MYDFYEVMESVDILSDVIDALDRYEIEDFLGMTIEEYLEQVETFRVTGGMFPKKSKHREVVRFRANDLDDVSQFFRLLKLMMYSLESEDLINTEEFGDTYSVTVRYSDYKYFIIKLNRSKAMIYLDVVTSSELVEELAIA